MSRRHLAGLLYKSLSNAVDFEASATVELYLWLLNLGENSKLHNYSLLPLFSSVEADGSGFTLREGRGLRQALGMMPGERYGSLYTALGGLLSLPPLSTKDLFRPLATQAFFPGSHLLF